MVSQWAIQYTSYRLRHIHNLQPVQLFQKPSPSHTKWPVHLLYQQRILPNTEYVWPTWQSTCHAHVMMLQVVQSSVFTMWITHIDTFTKIWRLQIFSDHIRVVREGFKSKLGNRRSPLIWNLEGTFAEQGLKKVARGLGCKPLEISSWSACLRGCEVNRLDY